VRGDATRERLLLAAEQLFAERGIAAVPLSEIARAAGQRGNDTIPYHFGDRDGLLRALTTYRARRTEERRGQMIADLLEQPGPVTVRDIVATVIRPLEIHFEPGNHNLGVQSRLLTERGDFMGEPGEHPMFMARELVCRRLPNLPTDLVKLRFQLALTSAIHALAHYQDLMAENLLPASLDVVIEDLIQTLSAAIEAPVSSVVPWPSPAKPARSILKPGPRH
jgi:AcrR family transcriptional regulator